MRTEAHLHISRFRKGAADCISVRNVPDGKVYYADTLYLSDVTFAVQPAGLKLFREKGRKNVHAFIRGTVDPKAHKNIPAGDYKEARYNPLSHNSFVNSITGDPVYSAAAVFMRANKVYYI